MQLYIILFATRTLSSYTHLLCDAHIIPYKFNFNLQLLIIPLLRIYVIPFSAVSVFPPIRVLTLYHAHCSQQCSSLNKGDNVPLRLFLQASSSSCVFLYIRTLIIYDLALLHCIYVCDYVHVCR